MGDLEQFLGEGYYLVFPSHLNMTFLHPLPLLILTYAFSSHCSSHFRYSEGEQPTCRLNVVQNPLTLPYPTA